MRHLIWYIRSAFCKHEWEIEEQAFRYSNLMGQQGSNIRVSVTCEHCGWHRRYNKY